MCLVDLDVSKDGAASDVKNHFSVIIKSVHKKREIAEAKDPVKQSWRYHTWNDASISRVERSRELILIRTRRFIRCG